NPAPGYLSGYFAGAFNELGHIIAGAREARPLFTSTGGVIPIWDSLLRIASVTLVTCCIPFGLFGLWRQYRHNALAVMLGILSLAYPITQVFRITQFGTEITDRAAAFLFLSVACILAFSITLFLPTRHPQGDARVPAAHPHRSRPYGKRRRAISLITGILTVVFIG